MEVNPSVPTRTLPEFIAYAKANPGKINMASAGSGSTSHVTGELFKMMADVEMIHGPYRGSSPALSDLLGGQVQVMFDATPSSLPHIRAGKIRPLVFLDNNPHANPDDMKQGFLIEDADWTTSYFDPTDRRSRMARRLYFAGGM